MSEDLPASETYAAFAPAGTPPEPTLLYAIERPRNGRVACGRCEQANHETRLWCLSCGHQLGRRPRPACAMGV